MSEQKKGNYASIVIGAIIGLTILIVGCFLFVKKTEPSTLTLGTGEQLELPNVAADYNAIVVSIEGNELVISRPLVTLSAEEQAEARAERQAMSPEERQASRAERTDLSERVEETIVIPIGIPMLKNKISDDVEIGSNLGLNQNDASGLLGDPELYDLATFGDIAEGSNISVWTENGSIILVRIKGGNQ